MKRPFAMAVALAAVLTLGIAPASATELVKADLGNDDLTGGGFCSSFNAEQSGNWGGEFGDGAPTAFPGDADDAGHCTFTWTAGKARRIELRVLDGIADDSFDVYVENPAGQMAWVYGYADQTSSETWLVHTIESFPAGKGQGPIVHLRIVPRNVGWSGFNTWGQLAVDYVALFDH